MNSLSIHNEFMKRQRTGELLVHHQPFILMSSLQSGPYTDEICAQPIAEFLERHPESYHDSLIASSDDNLDDIRRSLSSSSATRKSMSSATLGSSHSHRRRSPAISRNPHSHRRPPASTRTVTCAICRRSPTDSTRTACTARCCGLK